MAIPKFTATQLVPYPPGKEPMEFPPEDMSQPLTVADLLSLQNGIKQMDFAPDDLAAPAPATAVSSRAKHRPPASVSPAAIAQSTPIEAMAPPSEDPLAARQKDFVTQQREQLANALAEKDLSSEEKVAMALLSILPGLVGGIGGGIAAGGYGAAAGLAGGLQGGAQGMQTIATAKKERRSEALGRAQDLQDRIDRIDTQLAAQREKMETRQFTAGEAEKERKNAEKLLGEKQKFEKEMEGISHRHAMGRDIFQAKAAMDRARLAEQGDLQKAMLAASNKEGKPPTEFESKAALYATDMLDTIPRLKGGDFERASVTGALLNYDNLNSLRDPQMQQYAADAMTFLDAIARSRTGAGIRADEWATYYRQYFPLMGDSQETIALKRQKRETAAEAMLKAAGSAGGRVRDTLQQSGGSPAPAATKSLKDILGF
jgi:hypothetical protein